MYKPEAGLRIQPSFRSRNRTRPAGARRPPAGCLTEDRPPCGKMPHRGLSSVRRVSQGGARRARALNHLSSTTLWLTRGRKRQKDGTGHQHQLSNVTKAPSCCHISCAPEPEAHLAARRAPGVLQCPHVSAESARGRRLSKGGRHACFGNPCCTGDRGPGRGLHNRNRTARRARGAGPEMVAGT